MNETRLEVKLVGASSRMCYTCHTLHIHRFGWPLTDAEAIQVANLAGFAGQEQKVMQRWEVAIDKFNKSYGVEVFIGCDSSD